MQRKKKQNKAIKVTKLFFIPANRIFLVKAVYMYIVLVNPLMSRIERKYCLISTSYLTGTMLWNNLSYEAKTTQSLPDFKHKLVSSPSMPSTGSH